MKPNIPKHPCANKCTEFKGEQCKTCLVQQIEKREFDLGLAPDDHYVKTSVPEYLHGDIVVLSLGADSSLYEFIRANIMSKKHCYILKARKSFQCVLFTDIRHATVSEIQANRRLTEAEQAIAEVS